MNLFITRMIIIKIDWELEKALAFSIYPNQKLIRVREIFVKISLTNKNNNNINNNNGNEDKEHK